MVWDIGYYYWALLWFHLALGDGDPLPSSIGRHSLDHDAHC